MNLYLIHYFEPGYNRLKSKKLIYADTIETKPLQNACAFFKNNQLIIIILNAYLVELATKDVLDKYFFNPIVIDGIVVHKWDHNHWTTIEDFVDAYNEASRIQHREINIGKIKRMAFIK